MKVDALVLAGSSGSGDLAWSEGVENKALVKIGRFPLVSFVLAALSSSSHVDRIGVVGPAEDIAGLAEEYGARAVSQERTVLENVLAGFRELKAEGYLLIVTSDIPMLTGEAVDDFLDRCAPFDCDFYYPIIPRESCEEKYPGLERTYVRLREGVFTGGNMFLVNAAKLEEGIPKFEYFFRYRKNPLKMGRLLGPALIFKFITRTLKLRDIEGCFLKVLDIKARAVISSYPEIGVDVDKQSDLEVARRFLSRREE